MLNLFGLNCFRNEDLADKLKKQTGAGAFWKCINNKIIEKTNLQITGLNGSFVTSPDCLSGRVAKALSRSGQDKAFFAHKDWSGILATHIEGTGEEHWLYRKMKAGMTKDREAIEKSASIILNALDHNRSFIDRLLGVSSEEKLCRLLFREMTRSCTVEELRDLVQVIPRDSMESSAKRTQSIFQATIKFLVQTFQNPYFKLGAYLLINAYVFTYIFPILPDVINAPYYYDILNYVAGNYCSQTAIHLISKSMNCVATCVALCALGVVSGRILEKIDGITNGLVARSVHMLRDLDHYCAHIENTIEGKQLLQGLEEAENKWVLLAKTCKTLNSN